MLFSDHLKDLMFLCGLKKVSKTLICLRVIVSSSWKLACLAFYLITAICDLNSSRKKSVKSKSAHENISGIQHVLQYVLYRGEKVYRLSLFVLFLVQTPDINLRHHSLTTKVHWHGEVLQQDRQINFSYFGKGQDALQALDITDVPLCGRPLKHPPPF